EFVKDDAKEPYPDLVLAITKQALARGLIVIRAGLYSNCIRLLPPLDLSDDQIDEGLAVLGEAYRAAVAALAPTEHEDPPEPSADTVPEGVDHDGAEQLAGRERSVPHGR